MPAQSGETIETVNPFDSSAIASVAAAGAADVDAAVKAARAAFRNPAWRGLSAAARGALLYRLAEVVEREREVLATIDAWDNGKPYAVALGEDLAESVAVFKYYAGWADKIYGQTIETSDAKLAYTKHEPVGKKVVVPLLSPIHPNSEGRLLKLAKKRRCLWPDYSLELSYYGLSTSPDSRRP